MPKSKPEKGSARTLDRSPSHLLHRVLQLALDLYAEEAGTEAVTQRQFALLAAAADHDGATQTVLVGATGIDRSTLADLAARMITKGYLERERSAADARANAVRLTELGRATLETLRPKVAAADARILALLPPGKRDTFLSALRTITESAAPAPPAPEKQKKVKPPKAAKPAKAEKAPKPAKAEKPGKKQKKKIKKVKAEMATA
jgi:DNA-binding MarR family transcriptional regulator